MSDIVNGKDVVVFIYDGGIWKLYGCALSCTYSINTEVLETSVSGQGVNATFIPTKNSFDGSLSGLVSLEPGSILNYPDLQARQVTHQLLLMRFQRTSRTGEVYTTEASFYITKSSDTGAHDSANSFDIELKGTGIPTQVFVPPLPPLPGGAVFRYEYTGIGGESFFTDATLINRYILEANKDGIGFRIIFSGTPVNKEVKYTPSTGRFDWSVPFEPGEQSYIIWQEL